MKALPHSWFVDDAVTLAPRLLGKIIKRGSCTGIIVETEAYTVDPASHAYKLTPRSKIMKETYGHWYIYFTYGMYWCANVTTNKDGTGAVLIRAVEPLKSLGTMRRRRKLQDIHSLCSGPAKFCQAFGITDKQNGLPVGDDFVMYDAPEVPRSKIAVSSRIGISKGKKLPWRFYIKDNSFVSR
jgi:DNA-3-methyladenine glycosylase